MASSLAWAKDHLYADAAMVRIGPKALASLHNLRGAGVVEILVPTWLPADLHTDWIPVAGSMPTLPNDRRFYVLFDSVDKHADSLSVDEMKRILSSLRYFRIP